MLSGKGVIGGYWVAGWGVEEESAVVWLGEEKELECTERWIAMPGKNRQGCRNSGVCVSVWRGGGLMMSPHWDPGRG